MLAELCPQHGPLVSDDHLQVFTTRAEKDGDHNMGDSISIIRHALLWAEGRISNVPDDYMELNRTLVHHFNDFAIQKSVVFSVVLTVILYYMAS